MASVRLPFQFQSSDEASHTSVPLCYVYPAMLHYKAVARTRTEKLKDIVMMVFGLGAAAYTTIQTVRVSLAFS